MRLNKDRFEIQSDRMGVLGMSAGVHLSLMLGTTGDDGDKGSDDELGKVPILFAGGGGGGIRQGQHLVFTHKSASLPTSRLLQTTLHPPARPIIH